MCLCTASELSAILLFLLVVAPYLQLYMSCTGLGEHLYLPPIY